MRTKQSRTNQEARAAGKARRVRSGALGKLLIMLAIVAAVVFGVAIFFKVSTIEVQGNTVYSSEQIVEASQIQPGDNLLTVNKALAVGNIKAALPYVEDVSIARSLPDGIGASIEKRAVPVLPIFDMIRRAGHVDERDMFNTFNMGVGMTLIVAAADLDAAMAVLEQAGERPVLLGHTVSGEGVTLC